MGAISRIIKVSLILIDIFSRLADCIKSLYRCLPMIIYIFISVIYTLNYKEKAKQCFFCRKPSRNWPPHIKFNEIHNLGRIFCELCSCARLKFHLSLSKVLAGLASKVQPFGFFWRQLTQNNECVFWRLICQGCLAI